MAGNEEVRESVVAYLGIEEGRYEHSTKSGGRYDCWPHGALSTRSTGTWMNAVGRGITWVLEDRQIRLRGRRVVEEIKVRSPQNPINQSCDFH